MKYLTTNLLLIFLVTGCEIWSFEDKPGKWEYVTDFPGPGREQAVSFVIDDMAYIGLGVSTSVDSTQYKSEYISLHDLWKFDPATLTWTRLSDFPLKTANSAIGLSVQNRGFVIVREYPGNSIWEYYPPDDSWQKLSDFPGFQRTGAIVFTANDKCYFGLGSAYDTVNKENIGATDLWEYDPVSNSWMRKAEFPGLPRTRAVSFTFNDKAFICTGSMISSVNSETLRDVWEYGPASDTWTQKDDFGGYPRFNATAFSSSGKGYLGTGEVILDYGRSSGVIMTAADFWAYDYGNDTWKQIANYPGHPFGSTAFEINDQCYMGLGNYDWIDHKKAFYQLKITN